MLYLHSRHRGALYCAPVRFRMALLNGHPPAELRARYQAKRSRVTTHAPGNPQFSKPNMETTRKSRILVTGGAGYIGSVLVRLLLDAGYAVRVLDCLRSSGESLAPLMGHEDFEFIRGDIRDASTAGKAVAGCVGVAHLAAIVGDPACKKEPELARSTNLEGSMHFFAIANRAGCERFVFASTCSNYGKMADATAMG